MRKEDIDGLFLYRYFYPVAGDYDTAAFLGGYIGIETAEACAVAIDRGLRAKELGFLDLGYALPFNRLRLQ